MVKKRAAQHHDPYPKQMRNLHIALASLIAVQTFASSCSNPPAKNTAGTTTDPITLSLNMLQTAQQHGDPSVLKKDLADYTEDELLAKLPDDAHKRAFWMNVYNSAVVLALQKDPGLYKDRGAFFSMDQVNVAGHELSLDDIEHGMLRHSRIKLSHGYLGDPFPGKFERKFRVKDIDYRIHFALNCGAKSCPQIARYDAEHIDKELQTSTDLYLKENVKYDETAGTVSVPAFMGWFRGDFGGKKGILKLMHEQGLVPQDKKPDVVFSPYNWDMDITNFR